MNSYEIFQTYLALKLHLTTDYDFQKYQGKLPQATVLKLSNKGYKNDIKRLTKHQDPFGFLLANLLQDPDFSPIKARLEKELCEKAYRDWLKRTQSLTYLFTQELTKLNPDFDANFIVKKGETPYLLCRYLEHQISLETMTILLELARVFGYWLSKLKEDRNPLISIVWLSKKYRPFLSYDRKKFRELILKKWGGETDVQTRSDK